MLKMAVNGYTNLAFPLTFHWRPINTPKMATPIFLKRLKDETRRYAMGDAGLDDMFGLQSANQIPNRAHKASIAVVPTFEAFRSSVNPFGFQFLHHPRP